MGLLEILIKVRELLSNKDHWTKGYYARNVRNDMIDPQDPAACTFCMYGAIYKVCPDIPFSAVGFKDPIIMQAHDEITRAIVELYPAFKDEPEARFNDNSNTTHEDVLKVLDRAIELNKGE